MVGHSRDGLGLCGGLGEKSMLHGAKACANQCLLPVSRGTPVTNPLLSLPHGPSLTGPRDLIPSPSLTQPRRKLEGFVGSQVLDGMDGQGWRGLQSGSWQLWGTSLGSCILGESTTDKPHPHVAPPAGSASSWFSQSPSQG